MYTRPREPANDESDTAITPGTEAGKPPSGCDAVERGDHGFAFAHRDLQQLPEQAVVGAAEAEVDDRAFWSIAK